MHTHFTYITLFWAFPSILILVILVNPQWCQGTPEELLRNRKIAGNNHECANNKTDNLRCCMVHFLYLRLDVLTMHVFPRYWNVYQELFMIVLAIDRLEAFVSEDRCILHKFHEVILDYKWWWNARISSEAVLPIWITMYS